MKTAAVLGGEMLPYAIIYQPDGITKEQLWGAYRTPLNPTVPPLPEKYLRAVYLIETLERYNGQTARRESQSRRDGTWTTCAAANDARSWTRAA